MNLLLIFFLGILAPQDGGMPGAGQDGPKFTLHSVKADKTNVRRGEIFQLSFDIEPAPTWHIYPAEKELKLGVPTELKFTGNVPARVQGEADQPEPHEVEMFGKVHEGRLTITFPIFLEGGAIPGKAVLKGEIWYQLCDDSICLPPEGTPFSIPLTITEEEPLSDSSSTGEDSDGLLALIFASISGGLLSLLMPCVFPLIPITLSYFARQSTEGKGGGPMLSGTYALGIILTFTGLGFLLSVLLGPAGARVFAAHPIVNIAIALLFVYFALSMFGVVKLALPASMTGKLTGKQRQGLGGAFILGCLFSVVTFTCTAPIAATILALAAGGKASWAVLSMLAYSGTMAFPFLFLGFFPSLIKKMPKSGGWLLTTEHCVGFVEIGLIAYYFSKADQAWGINILNRKVMVIIYLLVSLGVAGYLLSGFLKAQNRKWSAIVFRGGFGGAFLALGIFLMGGLGGGALGWIGTILPPLPPEFSETLPEAMELAAKEKKPVFIDFTGVT